MDTIFLLLVGVAAMIVGAPRSSAQGTMNETAYVETVRGRVVVLANGAPTLLDDLDTIGENARLDLEANSELRICHYLTRKLLTLKGPLRASVSASGVSAENGKGVLASNETCVPPVLSTLQGGFITRNVALTKLDVPLRPSIKVINRGTSPIRKVALWDGSQQKLLLTFERNLAHPILEQGKSYVLVVQQSDGTESRMLLRADAGSQVVPLIVTVR
ncbi:MAG TPA: hypothetical protein VGF60_01550 [Xanthobacteraceae bacterium]